MLFFSIEGRKRILYQGEGKLSYSQMGHEILNDMGEGDTMHYWMALYKTNSTVFCFSESDEFSRCHVNRKSTEIVLNNGKKS